MNDPGDIVFYDIASNDPLRTIAPNPWKTRYALNFKQLAYRTEWVDMPNISSVRQNLGVAANRTLPDGSPYHTLPVIKDASTGIIIGDSFEIALYLDKTYTSSPTLIAAGTTGLTAAFNAHVDGLFTKYVVLADRIPMPPRVADKVKDIFAKRAEVAGFADMQLDATGREALLRQFEHALGELAKAYRHVGGTTDYFWLPAGTAAAQSQNAGRGQPGPYLEENGPVYADLIVGAWLAMMSECMRPKEWQMLKSWQDGFWGRLHDALSALRMIK